MTEAKKPQSWLPAEFVDRVRSRLDEGKRIRRKLPDNGRLHMDRPLPFLCVFRDPVERSDSGTRRLVEGEAAFLEATAAAHATRGLSRLVTELVEVMSARFGAFLIVEIWSAPDTDVAAAADRDDVKPTELQPDFVVSARGSSAPLQTIERLRRHLSKISILKQPASVRVELEADAHPPGLSNFLKASDAKRLGCEVIGLRVRPIYRDHESSDVYPSVLRAVKRGLGKALKRAFFTFAKTRTSARPEHYYSLGRRAMVKAVWEMDRRLSEISDSFDFLLQATPVNAEAAWREFRRRKFEVAPRFYYRPLAVEPGALKRHLFEVTIDRIEDPTLGELFRERQDELDRKLTMLGDIGTPRFVLGSLQVYGGVEKRLLALAKRLLRHLPSRSREDAVRGQVDATEFARLAEEEIQFYRDRLPEFRGRAIVRDDMYSGLLCSGGDLLIGRETRVPKRRVDALLQHEVGTHLVTHYNGLLQPFQLLHSGFAGYDVLQEGIAVLSEYLVGGLSVPRLRLLAARVLAASMLVRGASFVDTFRSLDREHDFSQRTAYTVTMRTYRGGGLTKDVVYLKGFLETLDYLKNGGELDPLFVGKIAADHIPFIRELQHRKILRSSALRPRYLERPDVQEKLAELRNGVTLKDLLERIPS